MTISMVKAAERKACKDVEIEDLLTAIKTGRWEKPIKKIRGLHASVLKETGSRKEARQAVDSLKKKLPGMTFSGQFSRRAAEALLRHSGLFCADLDSLGTQIEPVQKQLRTSMHVVSTFISPTGDGVKTVVRISDDPKRHKDSVRAVAKHIFELTGAVIDESGKDVSRLCFVSYDPDIYINWDAVVLPPLPAEPEPERNESDATIDLGLRGQIAAEMLGEVAWDLETHGFLSCPGKHLHTAASGPRDCEIHLDGTPTLHCFHNSCRGFIDGLNHELRKRIARAETSVGSDTFVGEDIAEDEPEEEAKPFPLHCLPARVLPMAEAVCATERVPESLVGCCALGMLSASIGAKLIIQSGKNRITRGNTYIMATAESGSGKTESYRHMARPLQAFEQDRIERWKEGQAEAIARRDLLKSDIKARERRYSKGFEEKEGEEWKEENAEKKEKHDKKRAGISEGVIRFQRELQELEDRLHPPSLVCDDITSEKLADHLAKNDEQMASHSPDALSIINAVLGRYNKLKRTDEGLYLKAFSGDPCVVHRMGREPIYLKSPCLSGLWLTQPDKLQSLLDEKSLNEGGLVPRILACDTKCEPRKIGKNPPAIPANVEKDYAALIFVLLETYRLAYEVYLIRPTPEALQLLNDHHDGIVDKRCGDLRDVTAYAARWNEQAWRIAVCLHAGAHGSLAHGQPLSVETAQHAIELADWFAQEQLRILAVGRMQKKAERLEKLTKLIRQHDGEVTLRHLRKNNGFKNEEVYDLAKRFPFQLVVIRRETGGRPSEVVTLYKT